MRADDTVRGPPVSVGRPETSYSILSLVNREMLTRQVNEHSVVHNPQEAGHINTCFAIRFVGRALTLLIFAAMSASLVVDFLVKTTGIGHAIGRLIRAAAFSSWDNTKLKTD